MVLGIMCVAFTKASLFYFEHNVTQMERRLNASIAAAKQEAIVDAMLLQARLNDEAEQQEMSMVDASFYSEDTSGSSLMDTPFKTDAASVEQPQHADEYTTAPALHHYTASANDQQHESVELPAEPSSRE